MGEVTTTMVKTRTKLGERRVILIRLPVMMLAQVDALRWRLKAASRAEVIRRAIEQFLDGQ